MADLSIHMTLWKVNIIGTSQITEFQGFKITRELDYYWSGTNIWYYLCHETETQENIGTDFCTTKQW